MAKKQDMDKGIAVNLAGTVPDGHGLAPIRAGLLDEPRERRWVIGQVVNTKTGIEHPGDADDKPAPTLKFVELAGVVDVGDCDQLAAMLSRVLSAQPGQRTLDEVSPEAE